MSDQDKQFLENLDTPLAGDDWCNEKPPEEADRAPREPTEEPKTPSPDEGRVAGCADNTCGTDQNSNTQSNAGDQSNTQTRNSLSLGLNLPESVLSIPQIDPEEQFMGEGRRREQALRDELNSLDPKTRENMAPRELHRFLDKALDKYERGQHTQNFNEKSANTDDNQLNPDEPSVAEPKPPETGPIAPPPGCPIA